VFGPGVCSVQGSKRIVNEVLTSIVEFPLKVRVVAN
jgi:hypothetical protein